MAINDFENKFYRDSKQTDGVGALIVADQEALGIEEGRVYVTSGSGDITAGTNFDFMLVTGSVNSAVLSVNIQSRSESIDVKIFEGSVFTGGTLAPLVNLNRAYFNVAGTSQQEIVAWSSPTISDVGTPLFDLEYVGEDNGGNIGDFSIADLNGPLVLCPNTNYLLRITPQGTGTIHTTFTMRYIDRPSLI